MVAGLCSGLTSNHLLLPPFLPDQHGKLVRFAGVLPGRESVSFSSYSALKQILVDRAYECEQQNIVYKGYLDGGSRYLCG